MAGHEAEHGQIAVQLASDAPSGADGRFGSEPAASSRSPPTSAAAGSETGHADTGSAISPEPSDAAAGSTDAAEEVSRASTRAEEMEFNLAVEIVYNRSRASWLTRCHQVLLLGAFLAGTTAASDIVSGKFCAVAAAFLAIMDLVFDPATMAASHREIGRVLHEILVRLKQSAFAPSVMDEAEADLLKLSATEIAPYNLQREIAYNRAITALGRDEGSRVPIPWYFRPFAQLLRFEGR